MRVAASGQVTSGLILGVVVGKVIMDGTSGANQTQPSLDVPNHVTVPDSTKTLVLVADAPDLIFEIQDGGTVPCTKTLIGMNTGISADVSSTVTGASGMATGTTAPTTTNSLPLKIMGIVNSPDNEPAAAYQKLLVMINQHYYMGGQTAT